MDLFPSTVGVGGTSDLCMHLAKVAATRPLGSVCADPEGAKLEEELSHAVSTGEPPRQRPARHEDAAGRNRADEPGAGPGRRHSGNHSGEGEPDDSEIKKVVHRVLLLS